MSSMMAFWNEPRGTRDRAGGYLGGSGHSTYYETHQHPFLPKPLPPISLDDPLSSRIRRRYITFEPDTGGWNNLRMSLENIIVLAAVSGRTLVLPPEQTMYLLDARKGDTRRGRQYTDFFNLTKNTEFLRRVPIISSLDFLALEGKAGGAVSLDGYNSTMVEHLWNVANNCEYRKKSTVFCEDLYDHYRRFGQLAEIIEEGPVTNCLVFDLDVFTHGEKFIHKLSNDIQRRISEFCGTRTPVYYSQSMHNATVWHFETMDFTYRLLLHYYALIFFTDPQIGNFYKRFVRDFLTYQDEVYCAAGKVVLALQFESHLRSTSGSKSPHDSSLSNSLDSELIGGFSSLHVRRGDLQFKEVKFDSLTWYNNTRECWVNNEVLYVATDETDGTFFDDFRKLHSGSLRFLNDYNKLINLDNIDPTLYGMIDTVISARGRNFAGTWFSTFSGYIIRLRGYYGLSKFSSYYSYLPRKYFMHHWANPASGSLYAREYPTGWTFIDGDVFVDKDGEGEHDDPIVPPMPLLIPLSDAKDNAATSDTMSHAVDALKQYQTPALVGAKKGHITCDSNVNSLAYWNDPQGNRDYTFSSPYRNNQPDAKPKYIAFQLDQGGFNNIRMSFEILMVLAKAMDRILILPPDQPMYLLKNGGHKQGYGLRDFFHMEGESFKNRVDFITMADFVHKEAVPGGRFPASMADLPDIMKAARECRAGSMHIKGVAPPCGIIDDYLSHHGVIPNITSRHECFVFDEGMYYNGVPEDAESAKEFCGSGNRKMVYFTKDMQTPDLLYIPAGTKQYRMLAHFYGYIHFTDTSLGNFFKRYIRDLVRYRDEIFCTAGKIIYSLQKAAKQRGFAVEPDGSGGYSALHVRRGDFQYKKMKISGEDWYENTKSVWQKNEILYIATDEKNKTFFEPFRRAGHVLYFLDDFADIVGTETHDQNHAGMIETIVAARSRAFAGTYFSTFSGYINRLRGYYGKSMKDSWYGEASKKDMMQEWNNVNKDTYAKEWPDAWIGIDTEVAPRRDFF